MTPARLVALVRRATGRVATAVEIDTWGAALACRGRTPCPPVDCVHDDEADIALRQHQAQSTYPATPADVRRLAVSLANLRVEAELQTEWDQARGARVDPTPEYLAARRDLEQRQAERQAELDSRPHDQAATEAARARALAELAELHRRHTQQETEYAETLEPTGNPT
ncbi:MAG: hypothetical protein JWM40_2960 [Frankiales bacterium]|nr:hypothetical protein [Frankiales bacterium]